MTSLCRKFVNHLWLSNHSKAISSLAMQRTSIKWNSNVSFNDDDNNAAEVGYDEFISNKKELEPQGVDPKRGWGFRGVHKAIICGKIGQVPVQKILRNGKTVTIFTVGTGGMYDQRILGAENLPKPAQWHRIAVHNEELGAYSVQQLVKGSSVFVEGDIETRVYNDSINGQVKNVPEICVRRDDTAGAWCCCIWCMVLVAGEYGSSSGGGDDGSGSGGGDGGGFNNLVVVVVVVVVAKAMELLGKEDNEKGRREK
ncbi:hypothetical protein IFM89_021456 [Coptis chinensis]|uniref:Single-stranded DNA-binding protein, mitochondrial n=1 Tax=Coptis chinensis TaxID=261450 RepID=A0A835LWQ2_9MAGN|nr:hypothetical protein IFM89_021456 [Coptis chinensis]